MRGRGLRRGLPPGPLPDLGVYLTGRPPPEQPWQAWWVRWPDFWLPRSPAEAASRLRRALREASTRRVEIACEGGVGRTGTALACLAVLDGVEPTDAVSFVRQRYSPRAVETPWQRRFVLCFPQL